MLLAALAILPCRMTYAQTRDTTHWNDEDLYTEEAASKPNYFAVGGGIIGGMFLPNLTDLNANVAQPFVKQNLPTSVFMLGGQGFVAVPWVKNLRVGGMGYGGTTTCDCQNGDFGLGASVNRMLTYSVGYGALTLDYVLPLNMKHFNIVPGIALGFGNVQIYAQQAQNRSTAFDIGSEFNAASINITHTYHSGFFLYMPQLQFEYSIKGFSMLRLAVGYQGTSMRTWTVDNGISLGSTDKLSTTNGSGLVVSAGLFFGLFP